MPVLCRLLASIIVLFLVCWPALVQAQTTTPAPPATATPLPPTATPTPSPSPTETPTPTLTPPPVMVVIQTTATPAPQDNVLRQVWDENRSAILLALITTIIASILVGVFLRQFSEAISRQISRLFHFLFDRYASARWLRWRFDSSYRRTLAESLQKLASSNIVDRPVQLDRVYVPVTLTEETGADGRARGDLIQWDEERRRRQLERSLSAWRAIERFPRLVVLGEPGAGKTTYLAHLAFMCAGRRRLPDYTPIFLRLRDLAGVAQIEAALPTEFAARRFPNAAGFITRRLEAGRCLLLLDGLDEVDDADEHTRVVEMVQAFADRWAQQGATAPGEEPSGNIIVVSCRTYSYAHGAQLTGFTKTLVMDFDEPATERFVHNWFGLAEEGELADELLAALDRSRRFRELARNPLLLLLIAYHYERERNLPDLRAELYRHCIRTRITLWNTQRGTHRGRFGETEKWRLLRQLALDIYREEWHELLDQEHLLAWMEGFAANLNLPEGATAADLLDEVVRTSGLLQERALGRYGFSHLTLQEYFAAEGVERLGPGEGAALLARHLDEPRWQEIVTLYCGLADDADPLLRQMAANAEILPGMAELGLGDPGTAGIAEPQLGNGWLLAGRCLAEGARGVSAEVRRQVSSNLVATLRAGEAGGDKAGEIAEWLGIFAPLELPGYISDLLNGEVDDLLLAAMLLDEMPDDAEPALREAVSDRLNELTATGDTEERRAAAAALGRVATLDDETLASLHAQLDDPDPANRGEAARALARLDARDPTTAARLLRLWQEDTEDEARHAALHALLALGRAAEVYMVHVPAGDFTMGSADDDRDADDDEKPQNTIYLPAYYLDRTPVTNAQYRRFMAAGGYANADYWHEAIDAGCWENGAFVDYDGKKRTQPIYWDDERFNGDDQPVVGVTWYEALAYARWAGKRLPSEAEWEKAAAWKEDDRRLTADDRRPTTDDGARTAQHTPRKRRYPWGDEWDAERCNSEESGPGRTTPVGAYSPKGDSPYDAVDMGGNVWEWCQSRFQEYPYDPDDGREELSGGDNAIRVLRGGSWYNDRSQVRCAARFGGDPRFWDNSRGFRCCATSSPSGSEF